MNRLLLPSGFLALALLFSACNPFAPSLPTTFQECVDRGNPVMESYPRRCRTPQGTIFVESLGEASSSANPVVGSGFVLTYFMNNERDPEMQNCDQPYPVSRRITGSGDTLTFALQELLRGPSSQEASRGFFTSLPSGVKLLKAAQNGDRATLDFSAELSKDVAGSCRVLSIRSQIEKTALRLPGVQRVTISINGKTDEVLQP